MRHPVSDNYLQYVLLLQFSVYVNLEKCTTDHSNGKETSQWKMQKKDLGSNIL